MISGILHKIALARSKTYLELEYGKEGVANLKKMADDFNASKLLSMICRMDYCFKCALL